MSEFTHFNESGRARMVDISAKDSTERLATVQAKVLLLPEALKRIHRGKVAEGDVLHQKENGSFPRCTSHPDGKSCCLPAL